MADTTISSLPYPEGSDANNVPSDMAALATALDGTIIKKLSAAGIAGLAAGEKPAGTVVYNTTTGKLQKSNGSTFVDVIDAAGGTMSGALAMGTQKITGLAAATGNGEAVRWELLNATAEARLALAGGTMAGVINMNGNKISNVGKGTTTGDAVARQQIQSGDSVVTHGTYTTVTFATAFGSTPTVVLTVTEDSPQNVWVSTVGTTTFRINASGTDGETHCSWIAVGN